MQGAMVSIYDILGNHEISERIANMHCSSHSESATWTTCSRAYHPEQVDRTIQLIEALLEYIVEQDRLEEEYQGLIQMWNDMETFNFED